MVHIDAHHGDGNGVCDPESGPFIDCAAWLPRLKHGGVACFHDVGSTFPAVDAALAEYTAGWEDLGTWDGLAIRRKP